jgi:hypothetical protein
LAGIGVFFVGLVSVSVPFMLVGLVLVIIGVIPD